MIKMYYTSYDIAIEYYDLFSNKCDIRYSILAENEEDAMKIAYECFLMEVGSSDNVKTHIRTTPLSYDEKCYVDKIIKEYLGTIRDSLVDMVYAKFIKFFTNIRGYGLKLSPDRSSFWMDMNNITCKIVYESGLCYIDMQEIIVHDKISNRKYIVKNNLQDYYIGV